MDRPAEVLRALSREECVALLGTVQVGRVGITVGGLPVILPVNFTAADDSVLFRTVAGTKLAAATRRTVVAFEADHFDEDVDRGWSVLVRGMATELTDGPLLERARSIRVAAWAVDGLADHFVRVSMVEVSGRRFGGS